MQTDTDKTHHSAWTAFNMGTGLRSKAQGSFRE